MPSAVAYHVDSVATAQPRPPFELEITPPEPDAERRLVRALAALVESPSPDAVTVQVAHRGPRLEVTLRRAGLALALPRVEPVARAHGVAVASASCSEGVVTLSLLLPRAAAVRG